MADHYHVSNKLDVSNEPRMPLVALALEAQWHVMSREDSAHARRNETRQPFAVDHEHDDWRFGAVRGVEPTVLVRLAWSSWARPASPAPELSKIEPWPSSETAHDTLFRRHRIDESRQQGTVLAPVVQEDWPLEPWPAHEDVVRRSSRGRRRENEYRRQSAHKSGGPSHTSITPATARWFRSSNDGTRTNTGPRGGVYAWG